MPRRRVPHRHRMRNRPRQSLLRPPLERGCHRLSFVDGHAPQPTPSKPSASRTRREGLTAEPQRPQRSEKEDWGLRIADAYVVATTSFAVNRAPPQKISFRSLRSLRLGGSNSGIVLGELGESLRLQRVSALRLQHVSASSAPPTPNAKSPSAKPTASSPRTRLSSAFFC